jgi:hypothetical protein
MGTTSHRQATSKPATSQRRHRRNVLRTQCLGRPEQSRWGQPTKQPRRWGGGVFGERGSGHLPQHPSHSRPRRGLLDGPCLLPPIMGRCQKLRCAQSNNKATKTLRGQPRNHKEARKGGGQEGGKGLRAAGWVPIPSQYVKAAPCGRPGTNTPTWQMVLRACR